MTKNERARLFRNRLRLRLQDVGMSKSALARACQADRSTILQLLAEDRDRLPNAHLAAECASTLGVSTDWLLGLSDEPDSTAHVLSSNLQLKEANRTPADVQLLEWIKDAAGYKIRHVPASLPDDLKTETVIRFEYKSHIERTASQALSAIREKTEWILRPGTDIEICVSKDALSALIHGTGYWAKLSHEARMEQVEYLIQRSRDLYPSLRLYLYNEKQVYSAPITIFGPHLAIVYIGSYYMVLRDPIQIQSLAGHFDHLIRNALTDARSTADEIEKLAKAL